MAFANEKGAYIKIHIAVLLFGFTAILGDLIQLPAVMIVLWFSQPFRCVGLSDLYEHNISFYVVDRAHYGEDKIQ